MRNFRILHIISQMDPELGGVCQSVRTIIPELEKIGVQSEVVSLDSPAKSFVKEDIFTIHAIGPGKGPWCFNKALIPWLANNIARFDCIILHGLWQFTGYALKKAIKLSKKKDQNEKSPSFFIMPHGMLDPYFQKAEGRRLKAIRNWIYWIFIEQYIINKADGLLFTSEAELKLAKTTFFPYKPKLEKVVGLGVKQPPAYNINMTLAFQQKCPYLKDNSYLLFLSRIHEKKGVDLLIKAYASIVKSKFIKEGVKIPKLVIAGPGLDTSYGDKMKKLADSLVPNDIFFPGMLVKEAKWGAFYCCEAFILPSHQENFGIAVAEALACSKPVIITKQVNIWEEIDNYGGGLIGEDSLEDTRLSLERWLCLSDDAKTEMSKKARETYLKKFAVERNIVRLKEIIKPG